MYNLDGSENLNAKTQWRLLHIDCGAAAPPVNLIVIIKKPMVSQLKLIYLFN